MSEEITPGGSRIERHDEALPPEPVPSGWDGQERIEEHVERHLGPIATVFHELVSEYVHLDVLIVEATDDRPFHWLVTCGMSARPMASDESDDRYAELIIGLPADWPLGEDAWKDERHYWPVRTLKSLARMPHEYGFAIGHGHTLPNGDPPEAYGPGTKLCCALFAAGAKTPEAFDELETPDGTVQFLAVYLLQPDEVRFKLEQGADALMDAFDAATVCEIVEADRPSAVPRRKRFGLF